MTSLPKTREEAVEIGSPQYHPGTPCKRGHTTCGRRVTNGSCIDCHKLSDLEYRKLQPSKVTDSSRKAHLKRKYGLTPECVDGLMQAQSNRCAICSRGVELRRGPTETVANIDHCHETGSVRGILCGPCNRSLGGFQDDPAIILSAYKYLQKHKETP